MPPQPSRPWSPQQNSTRPTRSSREAPLFSPYTQASPTADEPTEASVSHSRVLFSPLPIPGRSDHPRDQQHSLPPLRLLDSSGSFRPSPPPSLPLFLPRRSSLALPTPTSRQPLDVELPFGIRSSIPGRRTSALGSAFSRLDALGHSLDNANSHLRALLALPPPHDLLNQPASRPPLPRAQSSSVAMATRTGTNSAAGSRRESTHSEDGGRISKRRRLDADKTDPPPFKAFRYGRYGQVEPGPLTMEIVSCDGGLYSDESYAAENILKNDNSVYCTKGNRCNIVLQHQGCTAFSLKELIIKAPGRNYSSPVREGMVFLSMSKDELLRTDQYQSSLPAVPHPPALSRHSALRSYALARITAQRLAGGNPSALEALDGPYPFEDFLNFVRHDGDPGPSTAPANLNITSPATFYVETECSDGEDDDAAGPGSGTGRGSRNRGGRDRDGRGADWRPLVSWSPTPLRNRTSRRLPMYEEPSTLGSRQNAWEVPDFEDDDVDREDEDEDEDEDNYTELYDLGDLGNSTLSSPESPRNDRNDHSNGDRHGGERPWGGRGHDSGGRARDSHGYDEGLLSSSTGTPTFSGGQGIQTATPHAEFHIEKHKNKCTIHFNPPVTARYILLKMWNPRQDVGGNIDIQGVVAKGFAGPRYFPALDLR